MGIPPVRPPAPRGVLGLVSRARWAERLEEWSQRPRVRDLPRGKLIKLTLYIFTASTTIFLIWGGPYGLWRQDRWLREARQLEQLGYRGRTDISETVRPGKTDYGFDYTKNYKERTDRPEP